MLPDRDQYLSNVAQAAVLLFQTRKNSALQTAAPALFKATVRLL